MGEENQQRKEQYKRARLDFEDLEIEDKALFLLEATVSTIARGIEQIGRSVADEFDKACRRSAQSAETDSGEATEHQNGATSSGGTTDPGDGNP